MLNRMQLTTRHRYERWANYAKQRYGVDIDVSDGPTYVDGREHNDLMFTK